MLAKTPPMGFNTWNTFGQDISDKLIRETADAMVSKGLRDAGYEYLVIDDCWSEYNRDPVTDRIVPEKNKFPDGMKSVSDYVHSKGLKFGMYSCAGVRTCADYPGSYEHEYLDARTFADYGCDYLKYDFCYKPEIAQGPYLYRKMGMALRACGREMLYSACNWGNDDVWSWIRSTGAHMYRSTGDINDSFESLKNIAMSQLPKLASSAPGCFNDTDMLTVGMYGKGNVGTKGCDDTDYRTEFVLWCMMGAPLMIGCDVRNVSGAALSLLTNKDLIAIDQDEEARPPFKATPYHPDRLVLVKHLSGNELAIAFLNLSETKAKIPLYFTDIGITPDCGYGLRMKNLFTGEVTEEKRDALTLTVDKHDCAVYRCSFLKK